MRPDEDKRRSARDGFARARVLLRRDMEWLPGFPSDGAGLTWQAFPWEQPGSLACVRITRESLRRMELTLSKLRRHFPRALPRVVDDVDDWLARMDHVLVLAKRAVHEGQPPAVDEDLGESPFPRRWIDVYTQLRQRQPELSSLLDAVYFLELTKRGALNEPLIAWIERNAEQLKRLSEVTPLETQLTLCQLAHDVDSQWLASITDLLTDSRLRDAMHFPCKHVAALGNQAARAARNESAALPKPATEGTLREALLDFIAWLVSQRGKRRRNATALLASIVPRDIGECADRVTAHIRQLESTLVRLGDSSRPPEHTREDRITCSKLKKYSPSFAKALMAVENLSTALMVVPQVVANEQLAVAVLRILSRFSPANREAALRVFAIWNEGNAFKTETSATSLFQDLAELFSRHGVPGSLMRHWRSLVNPNPKWPSEFVVDTLEEAPDRRTRRKTVRLLEHVVFAKRKRLSSDQLLSLVEFAVAGRQLLRAGQTLRDDHVEYLLLATLRHDKGYCEHEIRTTLSVGVGDEGDATILQAIFEDDALGASLEPLGAHVADERLRGLVRRLATAGHKDRLARTASLVRALAALKAPIPALGACDGEATWPERYPAALRPSLLELARVTPDASQIATRLLAKEFPDTDSLRCEITAIEREINKARAGQRRDNLNRLVTRRSNLEARLSASSTPSPARLARLNEKLRARADHEIELRFVAACSSQLSQEIRTRWGIDADVEELLQPPYDTLVHAILELTGKTRELGMWILCRRVHDTCDDFRGEAPNVAFLESLRRQGVRIGPWLDSDFHTTAVDVKAAAYTLKFTRDPLDVLLMGQHFGTCLSPGDINFFSALTNAVDINKQVVYGRRPDGGIIGRCLFTLTDEGRILTYRRYAHDSTAQFSNAVDQFTADLAIAMNTSIATRGRVSTLVASQWYDDGPVSAGQRWDLQAQDSEVVQLLRTADSDEILSALVALLGDDHSLRETLSDLLWLPEFSNRQEIVGPFLARYGRDSSVPFADRMRLAVLAHQAGLTHDAAQAARCCGESGLLRRMTRKFCHSCSTFHDVGDQAQVFSLITDISPSLALRLLRKTRSRRVRGDLEEKDEARRRALAMAHARLGRDRLVEQLTS